MYFSRYLLGFLPLKQLAICFGLSLTVQANLASAAIVTGFAQLGFGEQASVQVTLDDVVAGPGNILVTVQVIPAPNIGDIRGVYFQIADESLLEPVGDFSVSGPDVTDSAYGANTIESLSNGTHIQPNSPFDMGFEIGTAGIIDNDIQTTTFVISNDQVDLDVSLFQLMDFGVRLSNVSPAGGARSHLRRSKLIGTFSATTIIPEPTTSLVLSLFAAFGIGRTTLRRTRKTTSR